MDLTIDYDTEFAPAARLTDEAIMSQAEKIKNQNVIPDLFNLMPYILIVLNRQRQIVFSNDVLFEMLGLTSKDGISGMRPGEALNCVYSDKMPGGCGTAEQCSVCGAVLAILESQKTNVPVTKECLLTTKGEKGIKSYELLVYAVPININQDEYTVFMVKDIGEEKRKQVFERVFFHDLLNTSGAVKGFLEIIKQAKDLDEAMELAAYAGEATDILIDEVNSHKDLLAAENENLKLNLSSFSARDLIVKLVNLYLREDTILSAININCFEDVMITSDIILVRRIVNNMLKNAVEASGGDSISIGLVKKENFAEFWVHNKQFIGRDARLQIFKRSYSSKGNGRGIGTYSMKLLGEQYLGGYVYFTSEKDTGTTFTFGVPINQPVK